jgi:dihydrofolate synthase/folylpolyglutamate synthase
VTGATGDGLAVVRRRAARLGVPLTVVEPAPLIRLDRDGIEVSLPRLGPTRIGLRGRHQAANVAVADAVLDALSTAGIAEVSAAARRTGYAAVRWPGRLELIDVDGREVLLDGAHNPAGAATLATALDDLRPHLQPGPLTMVAASMADKDVDGIVAALAATQALDDATIIATALDLPRAMPAAELAARWRALGSRRKVVVEPDAERALERALEGAQGPIVVAGSLYLVGAVRARLVDDPLLRDPVTEAAP